MSGLRKYNIEKMTHFEQNFKAHQMHREHEKRARGAKLLEGKNCNLNSSKTLADSNLKHPIQISKFPLTLTLGTDEATDQIVKLPDRYLNPLIPV